MNFFRSDGNLSNALLIGRVTFVPDGDTIQFTPLLKKDSILLRLSGIDAPEAAKKGNPGQPFAQESRDFLSSKLLNRIIMIKTFDQDQYGRLIGTPYYFPFLLPFIKRNICVDSLSKGLSVVYHGKGEYFGGEKDLFLNAENSAKENQRGVWSLDSFETPSEFKRRHRKD